jgi:hypothetical protein
MGWVSQSSNTSNVMTAAASVPNLTGLGNGAEAPEDMEEVLHNGGGSVEEVLHRALTT